MKNSEAINQYINVLCEEYALLTDIANIEQVVMADDAELTKSGNNKVQWLGKDIPFVDLTEILMGHKRDKNKHCVIMKEGSENCEFLAVAVGEVANIQAIKEEEFESLPHLDFPFNNYFDKAYITKGDKRCIYRLKNLVSIVKNA